MKRLELGDDVGVGMLEQLGVDPLDVDLGAIGDAAMDQRLAQALVGVGKADIFADDADRDLALVMVDAVHDLVPAREIGLRRIVDPEGARALRRRARPHDIAAARHRCCARRAPG